MSRRSIQIWYVELVITVLCSGTRIPDQDRSLLRTFTTLVAACPPRQRPLVFVSRLVFCVPASWHHVVSRCYRL